MIITDYIPESIADRLTGDLRSKTEFKYRVEVANRVESLIQDPDIREELEDIVGISLWPSYREDELKPNDIGMILPDGLHWDIWVYACGQFTQYVFKKDIIREAYEIINKVPEWPLRDSPQVQRWKRMAKDLLDA